MNLKPKPTPCHFSAAPPTPAVGAARAWKAAVRRSLSSPVIWRLPKYTVSPPTAPAHFFARPTHCLLSLSSPRVAFLQTHLCVSLSPSHSYDLGVRVALAPSQPWIQLPCHYSVIPPARVLHVRRSGACLPACLLALPLWTCRVAQFNHRRPWSVKSLQLWHRLLGKLCRAVGRGVSASQSCFFNFTWDSGSSSIQAAFICL